MNKESTTDTAPTKLRNLSDDVLQSAEEAVKATHEKANQLLNAAEGGVKQLRAETSPAIQDLAARAQDIATRSIDCAPRPATAHAASCTRCLKPLLATWPSSLPSRWPLRWPRARPSVPWHCGSRAARQLADTGFPRIRRFSDRSDSPQSRGCGGCHGARD